MDFWKTQSRCDNTNKPEQRKLIPKNTQIKELQQRINVIILTDGTECNPGPNSGLGGGEQADRATEKHCEEEITDGNCHFNNGWLPQNLWFSMKRRLLLQHLPSTGVQRKGGKKGCLPGEDI